MNQSRSNMNSPTAITRKSLFPIVTKHIDRVSAAQWCKLTAGIWDSDIQKILADMLMEVIQKLSRYVFKTSMCKETGTVCEDDINAALENLRAQLGDSLPGTLADALHVSPNNCKSAEPLKRMVQDEVSRKVKSVLSNPSKVANIINASLSNIKSLAHLAAMCLRDYLARVNPKCLRLFFTLKASEEQLELIKCQLNEDETESEVDFIDITETTETNEITETTETNETNEITEVTEILIKPVR
ncbi:hypothetical protein GBF38_021009 [Nibea albiflora]|uniref:Uncharacterized protein n=1 Tax=Nibea albiflora TaxID=240163 RepID=A0ACB7EWE9_NIBAL|nr:hypothetical protein GBF38_021009 [Nibea albiflora]